MTASRLFAIQAVLAVGVAIAGLIAEQGGWVAGGVLAAILSTILWDLFSTLDQPDQSPTNVRWRTTAPFGVERIITSAHVETELVHKPAVAHTVIPVGRPAVWRRHPDHRPVWDTTIFGAPE